MRCVKEGCDEEGTGYRISDLARKRRGRMGGSDKWLLYYETPKLLLGASPTFASEYLPQDPS